jgi:hypothetical protein
MNKRTAYVYGGAAFLILIFGFRTLARTVSWLTWIVPILTPLTVIALLLEFVLLLYYAKGFYDQNDSLDSDSGGSVTTQVGDSSGLEKISNSMQDYSNKLQNIEGELGEYNNQIKNLNEKIDTLVDAQLDEKVKNILAKLLKDKL